MYDRPYSIVHHVRKKASAYLFPKFVLLTARTYISVITRNPYSHFSANIRSLPFCYENYQVKSSKARNRQIDGERGNWQNLDKERGFIRSTNERYIVLSDLIKRIQTNKRVCIKLMRIFVFYFCMLCLFILKDPQGDEHEFIIFNEIYSRCYVFFDERAV